jgi:hypothetical protein
LLVVVESLAGGVPAFDPLGRAASPLDAAGSGVSPAKAEALVISTAAKSKLGSRNSCSSLSQRRKGNVEGEALFQRKRRPPGVSALWVGALPTRCAMQ